MAYDPSATLGMIQMAGRYVSREKELAPIMIVCHIVIDEKKQNTG